MYEELVLGEADVVGFFGWVDNAVGALLQRAFELRTVNLYSPHEKCGKYQGNDVCRLCCEFMRQLLVVRYEVRDVDIAVVLLDQDVFADLISTTNIPSALPKQCANTAYL